MFRFEIKGGSAVRPGRASRKRWPPKATPVRWAANMRLFGIPGQDPLHKNANPIA